jgi:hypothetical protein
MSIFSSSSRLFPFVSGTLKIVNNKSRTHITSNIRNVAAPPNLLSINGKTRIRRKFAIHSDTIDTDIALLRSLFGNISDTITQVTAPTDAEKEAI